MNEIGISFKSPDFPISNQGRYLKERSELTATCFNSKKCKEENDPDLFQIQEPVLFFLSWINRISKAISNEIEHQ